MKKTFFKVFAFTAALTFTSAVAYGAQWYDDAVNHCKSAGYISEDYDINGMLTRGEMAEMLSKAAGLTDKGSSNPFTDLSDKESYADDIIMLYDAGIFAGSKTSDGKLKADAESVLTREQAASFIIRAYDFEESSKDITFKDADKISDYALDDIKTLVSVGVFSGYEDNTIRPDNKVSKTEFMTMIYKADTASGKAEKSAEKIDFTADKQSLNLKVSVLNTETVIPTDELKLSFTRYSSDPGALYVYNPQKFQLEKNVNGEWSVVERDHSYITEIEYQLKADSSSERKIILSNFYDGLEDGNYRIIYEFSVNGVGIEKRKEYAAAEFNLKAAPEESKLYDEIEKYMEEQTMETFSKYYEIKDCIISNYEENENGTEAIFSYKIIHKNFDKDPDTVDYIKEAKESGNPNYETYYKEYLEPKEMNMYFKAVVDDKGNIKLYTDVDPTTNTDWQETKMSDFILK